MPKLSDDFLNSYRCLILNVLLFSLLVFNEVNSLESLCKRSQNRAKNAHDRAKRAYSRAKA